MAHPSAHLIQPCIDYLQAEFKYIYGNNYPEYFQVISPFVWQTLGSLSYCDAAYHNLDHTLQVTLVGNSILYGKFACDEVISPQDWVQFMLSLLCHDMGYLKGACRGDSPGQLTFVTAQNVGTNVGTNIGTNQADSNPVFITLNPTATGASLTPFHVDRSKQFVAENFSFCQAIDIAAVQWNIELTRFPVPTDPAYQETGSFAGLTRAADLIGQLGDPAYLSKLPSLFQEFEETGSNRFLGYQTPQDLREGYPRFYWKNVSLYLKNAIRYLEMSKTGRATLETLYHNRIVVEQELDRYYNQANPFAQGVVSFWHWAWEGLTSLLP